MERRVLDIAEGRRHLAKKRGALAVTRDPDTPHASQTLVPFDEIESVIVHTPQATYSNAAIVELAQRGIPLICCDPSHTPVAWLWPARANYEQTRRMAAQAAIPEALRDGLWATIVRAKIEAQADVLREAGLREEALTELARGVRPGDPDNAEARAAQSYWWLLFENFRRDPGGAPPNGQLNYGYAVLRATVARQLCAAGLHPSLGLHHKNRFNAFCLADDLMEPVPALGRSRRDRALAGRMPRGDGREQAGAGRGAGGQDDNRSRRRAAQPLCRVGSAIARPLGTRRREPPAPATDGHGRRVSAFSGYRFMWMMVLFDLPVITKRQRKRATKFRNDLLDLGFEMAQYSVYLKFCGSRSAADALSNRVERRVPAKVA